MIFDCTRTLLIGKMSYIWFSGFAEALDDSFDIVVPQDVYALYAIDILAPSFVSIIRSYIMFDYIVARI